MAKNREKSEFVFGEQFEPDVFWEEHGRQVLGVVALVAVVGLGLFIWQRQAAAAAERAADQLVAARDVASLERVSQQYAGEAIGALASLELANRLLQERRLDEAAQRFEAFLREYPGHELAPSARLGLAAVEESRGNLEAAKGLYAQLTQNVVGNYVALAARSGIGRCAEGLGQTDEARRVYEELMALAQGSPVRMDAYLRLTVLGRNAPETGATSAVPAVAGAVPAAPPEGSEAPETPVE